MEKRAEQIKRGLEPFGIVLTDRVIQRELDFLDELLRWNERINLTAIRDQQEGVEKHLIDSLVLLSHCKERLLLDVGSGAGIPSIPLAIADRHLEVVSVESIGKKVNFQKHIRRQFGLKNFTPLNCRVENLPLDRRYPLITARAFAPIDRILQLVDPFLEKTGRLLLLRGSRDEVSLQSTEAAMRQYGFELSDMHSYKLPFSQASRQILQLSRK